MRRLSVGLSVLTLIATGLFVFPKAADAAPTTYTDTTRADFENGETWHAATEEFEDESVEHSPGSSNFNGPVLGPGWNSSGNAPTMSNGSVSLDGGRVGSDTAFTPNISVKLRAKFTGPGQHIGIQVDGSTNPYIAFTSNGSGVVARINTSTSSALQLSMNEFHTLRIDVAVAKTVFTVDRPTGPVSVALSGQNYRSVRPLVVDENLDTKSIEVDEIVRVQPKGSPSNDFAFNADNWQDQRANSVAKLATAVSNGKLIVDASGETTTSSHYYLS